MVSASVMMLNARKQKKKTFFRNQILLCALNVNLVWLTSWTIVSFLSSFLVSSPSQYFRHVVIKNAIYLSDEYQELQTITSILYSTKCLESAQDHIKNEENLYYHTRQFNRKQIMLSQKNLHRQGTHLKYMQSLILENPRGDRQIQTPFVEKSHCAYSNRKRNDSILFLHQKPIHKIEPAIVPQDFVKTTEQVMKELAKYTLKRAAYDYEFFVQNQTNTILEHLSSLVPSHKSFMLPLQGIQGSLNSFLQCTFPTIVSSGNKSNNFECPHGTLENMVNLHLIQPIQMRMIVLLDNLKSFQFSITQIADEMERRTKMLQTIVEGKMIDPWKDF